MRNAWSRSQLLSLSSISGIFGAARDARRDWVWLMLSTLEDQASHFGMAALTNELGHSTVVGDVKWIKVPPSDSVIPIPSFGEPDKDREETKTIQICFSPSTSELCRVNGTDRHTFTLL